MHSSTLHPVCQLDISYIFSFYFLSNFVDMLHATSFHALKTARSRPQGGGMVCPVSTRNTCPGPICRDSRHPTGAIAACASRQVPPSSCPHRGALFLSPSQSRIAAMLHRPSFHSAPLHCIAGHPPCRGLLPAKRRIYGRRASTASGFAIPYRSLPTGAAFLKKGSCPSGKQLPLFSWRQGRPTKRHF